MEENDSQDDQAVYSEVTKNIEARQPLSTVDNEDIDLLHHGDLAGIADGVLPGPITKPPHLQAVEHL